MSAGGSYAGSLFDMSIPSVSQFTRLQGCTYRQSHSYKHHSKVESLLHSTRRLLPTGELSPGHTAIIVERGHSSPSLSCIAIVGAGVRCVKSPRCDQWPDLLGCESSGNDDVGSGGRLKLHIDGLAWA